MRRIHPQAERLEVAARARFGSGAASTDDHGDALALALVPRRGRRGISQPSESESVADGRQRGTAAARAERESLTHAVYGTPRRDTFADW